LESRSQKVLGSIEEYVSSIESDLKARKEILIKRVLDIKEVSKIFHTNVVFRVKKLNSKL